MQHAYRSPPSVPVVTEPSLPTPTAADIGSDPVVDTQRALLTLLFNKYRGALLSHLTRLVRSPDDAAELVQETYLRVMSHAQIAEFESVARAYLFQTATNLARDHFRRQRWRAHEPLESVPEPDAPRASDSPEDSALWEQAMHSLNAALRAMPEATLAVFTRARLDNRAYSDIAHELGISVRTVERRMSEAMSLLTARLEELL